MINAGLVIFAMLAGAPVKTDEEMNLFLTYYYLKPNPIESLDYLEPLNLAFKEHKGASLAEMSERGGVRTFYAKVFESSPDAVREIEARLPRLPVDIRVFVNAALSRCASPECERVRGTPFQEAEEKLSPSTLDDYWAAFTATGESQYVEKVIAALPLIEVRGDLERLLVGGAAKWSLSSNAYQHSKVLKVCEDAEDSAVEPTKTILRQLIEKAKAERASEPPSEPSVGEI